MSEYCVIVMTITNKNGEEIESKLHKDLLQSTTYLKAKEIYNGVTDPDFVKDYFDNIPTDENDEFMSGPIKVIMGLLTMDNYLKELNSEYGRFNKDGSVRNYNMESARNIVKEFNLKNPLTKMFHAESRLTSSGKYHIKIMEGKPNPHATVLYSKWNVEKELDYNIELNNKLRELLKSYGLDVGIITALEERMGINGVMDTTIAKKTAEGLIEVIRLAEGNRGEKALPEEFAHLIIEALGDNHPIVTRLLNLVGLEGMAREILGEAYDAYDAEYLGNTLLLAKEALGKLVAKHLLKNESIPDAPYKGLLTRFFEAVKQFFKGLNKRGLEKDILNAIQLVNEEVGLFAADVIANKFKNDVRLSNVFKNLTKLFALKDRVTQLKEILTKILNNKTAQAKIAAKREIKGVVEELGNDYINSLLNSLDTDQFVEGIYTFITNAAIELRAHLKTIASIVDGSSGATTTNQLAAMLRTIKNFTASYTLSVKALKDEAAMDDWEKTDLFPPELKRDLNELSDLCISLETLFNAISMDLILDFYRPFVGDSLVMLMGKRKGETIKLEDLIKESGLDINFMDRWFDSMADSSDLMLRLFDHAVDSFKLEAIRRTLDYVKELQALEATLEATGAKGTDFMYDRDEKGRLTGKYIADLDYLAFEKAKDKETKRLLDKYGLNPNQEDWDLKSKEMYQWYQDNTEKIGENTLPKKSMYASDKYSKLTDALKAYYEDFIRIKKELDNFLPKGHLNHYNAVLIRKDLIERIKLAKSVKGGLTTIKESFKDLFVRREKDTEFGGEGVENIANTLIDFEGNKVMTLPIYFVGKLDNMDDLSTDATSALAAYASMAVDFNEMSKSIHLLELTRDAMRKRVVDLTENGKPVMLTISGYGRTFSNKLTKEPNDNNMIARLNNYFDMQIYGRYKNDEGTFGESGIDKGKTADFVNRMTSLNNLALNALAGVSNVGTGSIMMLEEAIAGLYFNLKDLAKSDKRYGLMLPMFMANIGSKIKTDKMSLWNEHFNILLDADSRARELLMDLKGIIKLMSMNTLFFMTKCGEHWMQTRTALSLASKYKMKGPDGKVVDLFEAMEVVPVKGNDLSHGGKLVVKAGYTKEDGTKFTEKDRDEFSNRSRYINGKLHGIYNKADMNAILKYALGRMAYMFRKWMRSAWNRRAGKALYNYQAGEWNEGFYMSMWSFSKLIAKDLKGFLFALMKEDWSKLSLVEKANIRRALTEFGTFLIISLALGLVDWPDDDSWFSLFAEYELRRLLTEVGAMTPTPLMAKLLFTIVKSPAASVDYIQRAFDIFNFANYGEKILTGRYKDMYRGLKFWLELIPMNRTVYKVFNPDQALVFLKGN